MHTCAIINKAKSSIFKENNFFMETFIDFLYTTHIPSRSFLTVSHQLWFCGYNFLKYMQIKYTCIITNTKQMTMLTMFKIIHTYPFSKAGKFGRNSLDESRKHSVSWERDFDCGDHSRVVGFETVWSVWIGDEFSMSDSNIFPVLYAIARTRTQHKPNNTNISSIHNDWLTELTFCVPSDTK